MKNTKITSLILKKVLLKTFKNLRNIEFKKYSLEK